MGCLLYPTFADITSCMIPCDNRLLRKKRDYIYEIWQFKVLSMKKLFLSKLIAKTWVTYKNMNKGKKSIANSSSLYQTYTPTLIKKHKLKSGPLHRRQVAIHSCYKEIWLNMLKHCLMRTVTKTVFGCCIWFCKTAETQCNTLVWFMLMSV